MEKIILGLLMYRGMTAYELKAILFRNFDSMCSNSSGSLHTALRKLVEKEWIQVQKAAKKKIYYITDKGRIAFIQWLVRPMDYTKARNMELSKIYFLGIMPREERIPFINAYLFNLENEKEILIQKYSIENFETLFAQANKTMTTDPWNQEGIKKFSLIHDHICCN